MDITKHMVEILYNDSGLRDVGWILYMDERVVLFDWGQDSEILPEAIARSRINSIMISLD